jgi:glycosyltransferase involved in cell wall biosynthesis
MRVAAVVPALDAEGTLAPVVREAVARFAGLGEVYVVDDGSRDATARVARALGATVLVHPWNRGKGAALVTGLERALADGHAAAVTIDADGQHPVGEAERLARLPQCDDALVLAVRDLAGANAPRANQTSNAISNGFLSFFARRRLRDTQCGLRRYPIRATLALGARARDYAFEAEVVLLAVAAGLPIVEVPARVLYPEARTTHFHNVRDPARIVARVAATLVRTRLVTRRAP